MSRKLSNNEAKYFEIKNSGYEFEELNPELLELIQLTCEHLPNSDPNKIESLIDFRIENFEQIDSINELMEELEFYLKDQIDESLAAFEGTENEFAFIIGNSDMILKDGLLISHAIRSKNGQLGTLMTNFIAVYKNLDEVFLLQVFELDLTEYDRLTS